MKTPVIKLTSEERKTRAKKAIAARWDKSIPFVTHGEETRPLIINDVHLPCYVLSNKKRVISQSGIIKALGMTRGSGSTKEGRIISFIKGKILEPFINSNIINLIENPIKFRSPSGLTYGYDATILTDICDAVLLARKSGKLQKQQEHIAERCEVLIRGFARVGIIALIDEATGYQNDRAYNELAKILEFFVAPELQPYIKKFPISFYSEICRLRDIPFDPSSVKKPQYFGHITNDIIYRRLAPGVLDKIKQEKEKPTHIHRWLTPDIGNPTLKLLLTKVVTIMELSDDWHDFKIKLNKLVPPLNDSVFIPLELETDSGKGI